MLTRQASVLICDVRRVDADAICVSSMRAVFGGSVAEVTSVSTACSLGSVAMRILPRVELGRELRCSENAGAHFCARLNLQAIMLIVLARRSQAKLPKCVLFCERGWKRLRSVSDLGQQPPGGHRAG